MQDGGGSMSIHGSHSRFKMHEIAVNRSRTRVQESNCQHITATPDTKHLKSIAFGGSRPLGLRRYDPPSRIVGSIRFLLLLSVVNNSIPTSLQLNDLSVCGYHTCIIVLFVDYRHPLPNEDISNHAPVTQSKKTSPWAMFFSTIVAMQHDGCF